MKLLSSMLLFILINLFAGLSLKAMGLAKNIAKNSLVISVAYVSTTLAHEAGHSIAAKALCGVPSILRFEPLKNPFISSVEFEGDIPETGLNAFLIAVAGPISGIAFSYAMLKICNVLNGRKKNLSWPDSFKKGLCRSIINRDITCGQSFFAGAMFHNFCHLLPFTVETPSKKYAMEAQSDGYRALRALNRGMYQLDATSVKNMVKSGINSLPIILPFYFLYDFIFGERPIILTLARCLSGVSNKNQAKSRNKRNSRTTVSN